MPNVSVNCTVSNCVFHDKGNICGAEAIEIDMDYRLDSKHNTEFASDFDLQFLSEEANQSSDTCCKTFRTKGK
ncbi:DUF1540 domain-containing protein [Lysinibacillus sphaericus]|uniref:DUF1540 domain-containing protein n=1 Tax=Lysinibacillus sphaericus TaxID=1421 RepID=UPI003D056145